MTNQCPRCATPRAGDYPFCQKCGLDFRAGAPAMPPQQQLPPQQPPYGAPQQPPPAYQPPTPQPQAAPAVCPRCNAPLYPGYTRCANCGYDSSAAWGTPAPAASSRGPILPIVLGLVVVGVLVAAGALIFLLGVFGLHTGSSASSPILQPSAIATASLAPAPTGTPTLADTPAPTPTPTSQPFVINDPAFVPAVSDSCDGDVQIKGVSGTGLTVSGTIPFINGQIVVFCYGAKHTWIGTLTYSGYTFASDTTDPLQFKVVKDQGYVYVGGTGTVTSPDGSVVTLPN